MELSSEVRQSVRAAVKAKLVEINAYVDEELPDYIMLLVAKKKTKKQMEEDLSLFLGINTKRFTAWLQDVLKRLETLTTVSEATKGVSSKADKRKKMMKDGKDCKKRKNELASNDGNDSQVEVKNMEVNKRKDGSNDEDDDYLALRADFEFEDVADTESNSVKFQHKGNLNDDDDDDDDGHDDLVSKPVGLSSTVGLVIQNHSSEDEDDDTPIVGAVPSVIQVKARTHLPKEFQPNKNLLLRAMADAQKSTTSSINKLTLSQKPPVFTKRYLQNLKQKKTTRDDVSKSTLNSHNESKMEESNDSEESDVYIQVGTNSAIVRPFIQHVACVSPDLDLKEDPDIKEECNKEDEGRNSPKFTVTLTGVPEGMLSTLSDEMDMEDCDEEEMKSALMAKLRCKYWPSCRLGAKCLYAHPTTHCKTFPQCQYGDKCLFIHPSCKFDGHCVRPNCPYTHITKSESAVGSVRTQILPTPSLEKICKFFPSCTNIDCTFTHPKPCKFGLNCKRAGCSYYHPRLPTRKQLKWSAEDQK